MSPRRRNLLIFAAAILLSFAVGFYRSLPRDKGYQRHVVTEGPIRIRTQAAGTIVPEVRFLIAPPVAGTVDRFYVEEGAVVVKGQKLAEVSSQDRVALMEATRAGVAHMSADLKAMYKPITLTAPEAGTIVAQVVNAGQSINAGDKILELANRLVIESRVDETDIRQIYQDQPVEIAVDAFPDLKLEGKVTRIGHQSTVQNSVNTYRVLMVVPNLPKEIRSGMSVSAYFTVKDVKTATLVPAWVAEGKQDAEVEVLVERNGDAVPSRIRIGQGDGMNVEVVEGLKAGDVLLSKPLHIEQNKSFLFGRGK